MRVSFVIPSRNQAAFIRRCVDGCLAQRVGDREIIVVDGMSSDGTQAILASYGRRVRWTSEPDAGQADAVNKGVARATGEIVAWINSDDCYAGPDAVPAALEAFEADPELDLVYGDALTVTADGSPLRPYARRAFRTARDVVVAPIGPSQPATLFRRELFHAAGGLRTDLHWALDYDLMVRLFARARRVRRLPGTIAWMTYHADAKSIRGMREQIAEAAALKRAHARALGLGPVDRARTWRGIGAMYAYWLAVRLGLRRVA